MVADIKTFLIQATWLIGNQLNLFTPLNSLKVRNEHVIFCSLDVKLGTKTKDAEQQRQENKNKRAFLSFVVLLT